MLITPYLCHDLAFVILSYTKKSKRWDPVGMHAITTMPRSHKQHHSLSPKFFISVTKNTNNKKGSHISREFFHYLAFFFVTTFHLKKTIFQWDFEDNNAPGVRHQMQK